jgi:pimeloyl-ACP methyl ester carboxylesterase
MGPIRERGARSSAQVSAPSIGLLLSEPVRGLAGFAAMPLAASSLSAAPRGDGHGVLVLPGLLASDVSTTVLRRFVRRLGYEVHGWNLGRNRGPTDEVLDELPRRLAALAERTGRPVSLIGWSLGGIYGRELARRRPALVRQVLTLGSPFALTDPKQSHADRTYRRRGHVHATGRVPTRGQVAAPIGVPSTAVYSRRDGIVAWQACIGPETALHENVEVRCAHIGFGTDPATLWLIADRLAVPVGKRQVFRPPPALRSLYPGQEEHSLCGNSLVSMPRSWRWRRKRPPAMSAGCPCLISKECQNP